MKCEVCERDVGSLYGVMTCPDCEKVNEQKVCNIVRALGQCTGCGADLPCAQANTVRSILKGGKA